MLEFGLVWAQYLSHCSNIIGYPMLFAPIGMSCQALVIVVVSRVYIIDYFSPLVHGMKLASKSKT